MASLAAIYTVIIWATHFALEPQRDGWHLSRRSKVVAVAGTAVALGIPLAIGGIA